MSAFIGNFRDIIVLVILFSFTIFVHELGHFLVALRCGMVVDTFSIGFGPALWKRKVRGIVYKIGCIPFGGYVALPQLDPSGMATIQGGDGAPDGGAQPLPVISPWKRILVSLAGATGNVILALVLAAVIWLAPQAITFKGTTEIGAVDATSTAYARGLRAGDRILAVNGKRVETWYDFNMECLLNGHGREVTLTLASDDGEREVAVPLAPTATEIPVIEGVTKKPIPCLLAEIRPGGSAEAAGLKAGDVVKTFDGIAVECKEHFIQLANERDGQRVPIVVARGGQDLTLQVMPVFDPSIKRAIIGVIPVDVVMPWMQEKQPLAQVRSDAMGIVRLLRALVTPGESRNAAKGLGGPVAIFATLWVSIKISLLNAVGFLRFLNVNLAILNLLPIPVLDGGHILFALWEGVTRRKAHPKVVSILVNAFAILLIGVFVLLTVKDVDRFIPGARKLVPWGRARAAAAATNAVDNVATGAAPAAAP